MARKAKLTKKVLASFEPETYEDIEKVAELLNEEVREFIRKAVIERLERVNEELKLNQ